MHNLMMRKILTKDSPESNTIIIEQPAFIWHENSKTPWHGLGETFNHNDIFTAIVESGVDYNVSVVNPTAPELNPKNIRNMYNDANGVLLGSVGSDYHPITNTWLFEQFHEVAVNNGFKLATMGALGYGERAFASYTIPSPDDRAVYMSIANSYDGSTPVKVMINSIMVVCQNTLRISEAEGFMAARHTKNAKFKIEAISKLIDIEAQALEKENQALSNLKKLVLNYDDYKHLVDKLQETAKKEDRQQRRDKLREQFLSMFHTPTGAREYVGSAYGAYMAITEVLTHQRPVGNKPDPLKDRLFPSATYGNKLNQVNNIFYSLAGV